MRQSEHVGRAEARGLQGTRAHAIHRTGSPRAIVYAFLASFAAFRARAAATRASSRGARGKGQHFGHSNPAASMEASLEDMNDLRI